MTTEDWKIQVSFKHGDDLVNVRGLDPGDFLANLDGFRDQLVVDAVRAAKAALSGAPAQGATPQQAVQNVQNQFPQTQPAQQPTQQPQQWVGQQQQVQNNQANGAPEQPNCLHGPMRYLQAKRGPNAGGFFWACPEPKESPNKCPIRSA